MSRHAICPVDELAIGKMRRIECDGIAICLAHAEDGNFYAIGDQCTHEQVSLSGGELFGCEVECPRHASTFSLLTGEASGTPAVYPVATYPVIIDGGFIYVDL